MEINTSDSRNLLSVSISHPEKAGSYTSRGWVNSQGAVYGVLAYWHSCDCPDKQYAKVEQQP